MKRTLAALIVAALTLVAAFAANLSTVPLARSCLVEYNFGTGAAPAAALVEWRPAGGVWKAAQPLVRVQNDYRCTTNPPTPLMAGMILGLLEGQAYEVRVTVDGAALAPVAFTTLTADPPAGQGQVVPLIVDENTTSAAIWNTLATALSADPQANAGKVIEIRSAKGPGVRTVVRASIASLYDGYRFWRWSGTAAGWLTLRVAKGHDVVFEGANPVYDTIGGGLWEPYEDDALGITRAMGVYRTVGTVAKAWGMYAEETADAVPVRIPNVTAGQRWAATSGTSSTEASAGLPTLKARAAGGEYAFCLHTDNRVYLRLPGGADPNTVRIKLPGLGGCLDLGLQDSSLVRYVVVEGLRFQCYLGNSIDYLTNSGVGITGAENIVLKGLDVRACPEYVKGKSSAGRVKRNIVIKGCLFREKRYADQVNWFHYKFSQQDNIGINMDGRGVSVLDSTVQGVFNGWSATGRQPAVWDAAQLDTPEGLEFDNCTWLDIGDDALEPEQFALGYALTRNRFERCYKGVSLAPVSGGPVYIVRNAWIGRGEYQKTGDRQAFTKFGNDDPGDTGFKLAANNTIVNLNDDPVGGKVLVGIMDSGKAGNVHLWNNYVSSDGFSIECGYGSLVPPVRLDGNVYRQRRPGVNLPNVPPAPVGTMIAPPLGTGGATQYWYYTGGDRGVFAVVRRSPNDPGEDPSVNAGNRYFASTPAGFAAWQQGVVSPAWPPGDWLFDPHSHFYVGSHDLVNPQGGDFRPQANSTAIGAGQHLDNITRYVGPGWAAYEEGHAANPTAGAFLASDAVVEPPTDPGTTDPGTTDPGTADLAALQERVASLEADIGFLMMRDRTITDELGGADARLLALEAALAGLTTRATGLESQVAGLTSTEAALARQAAVATAALTDIRARLAAVRAALEK